jgi:integrase
MVAFSLETGLRLSEQFHARWDCLNTEQGILTIPMSKSGKTRHVILSESALAIVAGLSSWPHSPFLFPSPLIAWQPHDHVLRVPSPAHLRTAVNKASLGVIAIKSGSGTGSKTWSNANLVIRGEQTGIAEVPKISMGMFGGAERGRTAASQFCRLLP